MGAQCTAALNSFKLPSLKQKNIYNLLLPQKQIDEKKLDQLARSIFCNNESFIKSNRTLLSHLLLTQANKKFVDPNITVLGQHLSNLYDYRKKLMKLYTIQNKSGLTLLQQQDVQLSYLSAVMFFLSQNKQFLRRRILLNNEINNDKQIYGFRFFCNGEQHNVIVDDIVPTTSHNDLKYCIIKEKQIWPPLIEKAWCKMIGSYDKAKGLSPQQCFEEITGLPASSLRIQSINQMSIYTDLLKLKSEGSWLCVVAYHGTDVLRPGHVFVIQKLDDQNIYLSSPYIKLNQLTKQQTSPGHLKLKFHTFRALFQYLIIGYIKKGYVPLSKKVICQKRQQKLFEIDIGEKQQVSIRFTQFYNGYMDDSQKSNYEYSPLVNFQLYDSKGILHFCQGCDKLYSGAHSIYFTKNIFHTLNKGIYFLRLEVDWQQSNIIKQGNIVIYASQNNVQIEQITDKNKIFQLHRKTLENPKSVVVKDQADQKNKQYELRFIQKKTNILISIHNKVQTLLSLQLSFNNSQNFRVKYGKLQKNKKVRVNLAPHQIKYLQIMPEQLRKQFRVEPFTVKKLPNPVK